MRRFLLFAGTSPPQGGWYDFIASFETREEARDAARNQLAFRWFHIVDLQTGEILRSDNLR